LALGQRVDEGLAVEGQGDRPPYLQFAERRRIAIDDYAAQYVCRREVTDLLPDLAIDVVQHRHLQEIPGGHVDLARDKGQTAGRDILDDLVLDAVEIGPVL